MGVGSATELIPSRILLLSARAGRKQFRIMGKTFCCARFLQNQSSVAIFSLNDSDRKNKRKKDGTNQIFVGALPAGGCLSQPPRDEAPEQQSLSELKGAGHKKYRKQPEK